MGHLAFGYFLCHKKRDETEKSFYPNKNEGFGGRSSNMNFDIDF